jgi:hypothetical protein
MAFEQRRPYLARAQHWVQVLTYHKNLLYFTTIWWRAPKSQGWNPKWGSHKVKLRNWNLVARSRLPTLERGRGSSWEPRD